MPVLNGSAGRDLASGESSSPIHRGSTLLVCLLAVLWLLESHDLAARAATGLAGRLFGGLIVPPLRAIFTVFLLLLGLQFLERLRTRQPTSLRALLNLPSRPTSRQEFCLPAILGWAAVVVSLIPLALSRRLDAQLWLGGRAWLALVANLLTLVLSTFAVELVFRSYSLGRLNRVFGPTVAVVVVSIVYAVLLFTGQGGAAGFLNCLLFSILLAVAWLRTHALWAPWGLHVGLSLSLGQIFGLPTFEPEDLSSVVQSRPLGHTFFLGHAAGPIGALWTSLTLVAALVFLIRLTRNFAWNYTHPTIHAGGMAVVVPPPAAHVAFTPPPTPPPLVQILSSTSPAPGRVPPSPPPVDEP